MESRTSLDGNGDGGVTPREYSLSQPKTGQPVDENGLDGHARGHFEREDYDHDGVISMAEIAERVYASKVRRFRTMQLGLRLAPADVNADGKLDFAELESAGSDAVRRTLGVTKELPIELDTLYGKLHSASADETDAIDRAIPAK